MKIYCLLMAAVFNIIPLPGISGTFYAGLSGGYGATTWEGLVPKEAKKNMAVSISAPLEVKESGGMWGAQVGYEFTPHFALEASYKHYPNAVITFEQESLFAYDHDDKTYFKSYTESASLMGKIMVNFPGTIMRFYSSAGIADVHREDELLNQWMLTPTFGVGCNIDFSEHFMGELGVNYIAGYGESELSPADDYVPFLYSIFFSLSYRF